MALNPSTSPSLTTFSLLSFDIFGTLIDDETEFHPSCVPYPQLGHDKALAQIYDQLASEWGIEVTKPEEAETFAWTMGDWAPFPDTIGAMQTLQKHFKLVVLSNVDRATFARTLAGPLAGVRFDAVYTAEDIGSYKPDLANFEYLLRNVKNEFGVEKGKLLHVAQGVGADHVPAKEMGLWSAWIARGRPREEKAYEGVGEEFEGRVGYQWRRSSLRDMANDVTRDFESL